MTFPPRRDFAPESAPARVDPASHRDPSRPHVDSEGAAAGTSPAVSVPEVAPLDPVQLLERLPGAAYVYDLQAHLAIYANRSLGALLGWSAEELRALGSAVLSTLIHPDDLDASVRALEAVRDLPDGGLSTVVYRARNRDGHERWLQSRNAAYRREPNGEVRYVVGLATDVSEVRGAAPAERLGSLASGVAHDFNNLLTVVQASADALVTHCREPEALALCRAIEGAAARGAELTALLLALAGRQVDAPTPGPSRGPVELAGLRITIVDDDTSVGRAIAQMVARLGAHVELFTSAVDALASLSVGPPVDLLLSDVVMAPIGGRELVERARAAGFAGAVLLMSGYPADELVREGIVRGDVELLEKPFTRAALREALDRALQHGRAPVATAR